MVLRVFVTDGIGDRRSWFGDFCRRNHKVLILANSIPCRPHAHALRLCALVFRMYCALSNTLQLRGWVSVVTTILPALQDRIAPKYRITPVLCAFASFEFFMAMTYWKQELCMGLPCCPFALIQLTRRPGASTCNGPFQSPCQQSRFSSSK